MTIGVMDSGLGGLTVLAEALRRMPTENYVYMADTLHVPYGPKSAEEVRHCVLEVVDTMVQTGIDALVVACNTATSIAVDELRARYSFPIVGMEPAVKPAVEMNRATGKRVLVFATQLTLQQPKYYALVSRVDEVGIVDSLPLPELVEYGEALQFDRDVIRAYFRAKLANYDLDRYGIVVLGCTHYVYYAELLREVLPPHIGIVDGNAGTVRRLAALVHRLGIPPGCEGGQVRFLCSGGEPDYLEKMGRALAHLREMPRTGF